MNFFNFTEPKCTTVTENVCTTEQSTKLEIVYEDVCTEIESQKCETQYDRQCKTVPDPNCSGGQTGKVWVKKN